MMQIFDLELDNGGPSFSDMTMYHIVAVPQNRLLWLKAPGYSGWERVDVGRLFH